MKNTPTLLITSLLAMAGAGCDRAREQIVEADAGGYQLHMLVSGEVGPTVVLESGLPGGAGWQDVRSEVSRFARVITYDRAGIGKSESGPLPRDARQIAKDLHTALHNAGFSPPYVLVGQSMGGPYIRVFAASYPDEVSGLVLVDPAHAELVGPIEDLKAWFTANHAQDWPRIQAVAHRAPEGSETMIISSAKKMEEWIATLPEPRRSAVTREFWSLFENVPAENISPQLSPGARQEFQVMTVTFRQAIAAIPLPKVPIILLAAGQPMLYSEVTASLDPDMRLLHQTQKAWKLDDYRKWVDATPGARLIIAKRSGHNIQTEDPQLVIDAIKEVIEKAESRQK